MRLLDFLSDIFIIAYFSGKEKGFFHFFANKVKVHKKFSNQILTLVKLNVILEIRKYYSRKGAFL